MRPRLRVLLAEIALPLLLGGIEGAFRAHVDRRPDFPLLRLMKSSIDSAK